MSNDNYVVTEEDRFIFEQTNYDLSTIIIPEREIEFIIKYNPSKYFKLQIEELQKLWELLLTLIAQGEDVIIGDAKKEIETKSKIVDLKKSDRKEAEIKYINKQIEKGELSQVAGKALITFVSYYATVSILPSSHYEKNRMFEFKRINDLPEQFRPSAEKELRKRLAQLLTKHNTKLTEQKDALTKIQIEVNADKIDIIDVADKINRLEASEELKNKLLTKIQKEGKINVFLTFKQLSNKMTRTISTTKKKNYRTYHTHIIFQSIC
jgi:hypothetical protein